MEVKETVQHLLRHESPPFLSRAVSLRIHSLGSAPAVVELREFLCLGIPVREAEPKVCKPHLQALRFVLVLFHLVASHLARWVCTSYIEIVVTDGR